MTAPGIPSDVPEADALEQQALIEPSGESAAREARPVGDAVPEADALEQQLAARPGEAGAPPPLVGDREANEADVLEQEADVPVEDDEIPD